MQLRPDGPWLVVPAMLLAAAAPAEFAPRGRIPRPAVIACTLVFVALNVAPTLWALRGHSEGGHLGQHFVLIGSVIGSPWSDPDATPRALAALVVLGACVAVVRPRKAGLLWLVATIVTLPLDAPATGTYANLHLHRGYAFAGPMALPVLTHDATFHQYANVRYHLPAMYLACGLAGLGTASLLAVLSWLMKRRLPAARTLAAAVVCIAALPRVDLLWRMWTPQREFAIFRDTLSHLDRTCRVVTMIDVRDAGFAPFEYLAPGEVIDTGAFLAHPDTDGCIVYYRSANCFTLDLVPASDRPGFEMNPVCRSLEQRFELIPMAESAVAALPKQTRRGPGVVRTEPRQSLQQPFRRHGRRAELSKLR
jgi:hypothetical protein